MRLTVALLVGSLPPAAAQEACTGTNVLGVSRTVQIDTTSGPKFGFQYTDGVNFLDEGEVVLTFDDGPLRAYTKPVLEALAAQCTKATFFLVGRMAAADPEMVKEYARRGHTVGTHTWSHANLAHLGAPKARAEIEMGFSAVQQAMGKPIAPFFRFPYLSSSTSMANHLHSRQIATFSIDVDSGTTAPAIRARSTAWSWASWRGATRASSCSTTSSRPLRRPCLACWLT
jgi:peptidoglycan/xylan/chitin deacetylase (PgdA/CDA1 family)